MFENPGPWDYRPGRKFRFCLKRGDPFLNGKIGEVAIRGPNVMTGYICAKSHWPTNKPLPGAGSGQGDQGYLDTDGYLFLTGRLKEQINRGGEKIAPLEIDQALLQHASVQQAVTFAMPHPTLGEEVGAAVVLYENTIVSESELQNFLAQSLG